MGAHSHAASAQYGVPCPACGAKREDPCRTLKTGRVTDTHAARRNLWISTRAAARR